MWAEKMRWISAVLVLILAAAGAGADDDPGEEELKLVYIMYRHGDRTPVDTFPTDPHANEDEWPAKFGQLTPRGKRMQYGLGKWLRDRYGHVLGSKYDPDVIYVRSTDVDRTLMSALSNLAGLYPPEGGDVWNPDLDWQPIPVHTVSQDHDRMLSSHAVCPRMTELIEQVLQGPEVTAINEKYSWLYDYLTNHTGANVTSMVQVNYIFDTLFIENLYNKSLPDWSNGVFPEKMRYLKNLSFKISTWTHEMKRLRMGPLLQHMVDKFQAVVDGALEPKQRKMFMFSGHDTTLSAFLDTLQVFDPPISPPYASTVMTELVERNEVYYVKLFYRNSTTMIEPIRLEIPGCEGHLCRLETFISLTSSLRPDDWARECEAQKDPWMRSVTMMSIVTCMVLVVILAVAVLTHCWRAVKYRKQIYFSLNQEEQP